MIYFSWKVIVYLLSLKIIIKQLYVFGTYILIRYSNSLLRSFYIADLQEFKIMALSLS